MVCKSYMEALWQLCKSFIKRFHVYMFLWSSLFSMHELHECDTNDVNETGATWAQQECYTNYTSMTQVKNFDFHNNTSKNMFSHLYISYMANERLQGEEQFHSKNYLLEMYIVPMAKCAWKVHHKNWTL